MRRRTRPTRPRSSPRYASRLQSKGPPAAAVCDARRAGMLELLSVSLTLSLNGELLELQTSVGRAGPVAPGLLYIDAGHHFIWLPLFLLQSVRIPGEVEARR